MPKSKLIALLLTLSAVPACPGLALAANVSDYANRPRAAANFASFSDVQPTDWAYQALTNLFEKHGCIQGYGNHLFHGSQAITRYEAAALLNSCHRQVTEATDEIKALAKEFERELAILRGRIDGLEARTGELAATQFSTTTRLQGFTTLYLNGVSGTTRAESSANVTIPPQSAAKAEEINAALGAANLSQGTPSSIHKSFPWGRALVKARIDLASISTPPILIP